jgi:hypothetical protein
MREIIWIWIWNIISLDHLLFNILLFTNLDQTFRIRCFFLFNSLMIKPIQINKVDYIVNHLPSLTMKKRSSHLSEWIHYLSTLYKVTWSLISTSPSFLSHRWNGWFQMNRWITLSVPNLIVIQRFIWNHSFRRWVLFSSFILC